MLKRVVRFWRKGVIALARRMPIESPGLCMSFSILFLLTAIYVLPDVTSDAAHSPLIAQALNGSESGWRFSGLPRSFLKKFLSWVRRVWQA